MSEETKKEVFIGDSGNTAEVTEEFKSAQTLEAKYAKELLMKAGIVHQPDETKYLGSCAIHYYKKDGLAGIPQYFVACQTDVAEVSEGHADIGWKQLRSAMMKSYGREEPKKVKR